MVVKGINIDRKLSLYFFYDKIIPIVAKIKDAMIFSMEESFNSFFYKIDWQKTGSGEPQKGVVNLTYCAAFVLMSTSRQLDCTICDVK